jgi:hypothetical protein
LRPQGDGLHILPVRERQVEAYRVCAVRQFEISAHDICGYDTTDIHRILRSAVLRCIAKFRFFEIEHRPAFLDREGDYIDPAFNALFGNGLQSQNATILSVKEQFHMNGLGPRMMAGMQINGCILRSVLATMPMSMRTTV